MTTDARELADADYIAEAITEAFGERCPDFEPGCHCCEAWRQYDAITEAERRGAERMREAVIASLTRSIEFREDALKKLTGDKARELRDIAEDDIITLDAARSRIRALALPSEPSDGGPQS